MVRRLAKEALQKVSGEMPTERAKTVARSIDKANQPTDQKLAKLREMDKKMEDHGALILRSPRPFPSRERLGEFRRNLTRFLLIPPDPLAGHHAVAAPFAVRDHRGAIDHHVLDSCWRCRRRS